MLNPSRVRCPAHHGQSHLEQVGSLSVIPARYLIVTRLDDPSPNSRFSNIELQRFRMVLSVLGAPQSPVATVVSPGEVDTSASEIAAVSPNTSESPPPRGKPTRTHGDAARRRAWWIFLGGALAAFWGSFIVAGVRGGDFQARVGLAVWGMLAFGLAWLAWGRSRKTPAAPEFPVSSVMVAPSPLVFPFRKPPAEPEPKSQSISMRRKVLLATLTLLPWALVCAWLWPDLTATWVLVTVVLHEAGHWWAMRRLEYSDRVVLFLPFVGGLVLGTKENATLGDRLFVLLGGPAPSLLLGCLMYVLNQFLPHPVLREAAFPLVAINLANLLPIWPLDGGQIAWIFLAQHSPLAQCLLSLSLWVLLGWSAWASSSQITLFFLLLLICALAPLKYRESQAALAFLQRYPDGPQTWEELSEVQLWDLYSLLRTDPRTKASDTANQMRLAFDRCRRIPRTSAPSRYLVAWMALWLLAGGISVTTALGPDYQKAWEAVRRQYETLSAQPQVER
jgi:Zn-dependent protease